MGFFLVTYVINGLHDTILDNLFVGLSITFVSIILLSYLHLGRVAHSAISATMIMSSAAITFGIAILLRNKLMPLYNEAVEDGSNQKLISMIEELAEIHDSNEQYATSGNKTVDSIINFKLHSTYDFFRQSL